MALTINDFVISEEAVKRLSDEDLLAEYFDEGKPLQELFGFSNEATAEFYGVARELIELKRHQEAVKAFLFLTALNPYISEFWLGLGLAKQQCKLLEDALYAFGVAYGLDGSDIFPYALAAQCCIDLKRFDRALEIIDEAEAYAIENDEKQLKKDAAAARDYVIQERTNRR